MDRCGFCSTVVGFFRGFTCLSNELENSDSYYGELGDQETLRIGDRSSMLSDDSDEIIQETIRLVVTEAEVTGYATKRRVYMGQFLTIHKRRRKCPLASEALLDNLHNGQVQCILQQSVTWEFNAFVLDYASGGRCLSVLCVHLFYSYGLVSHFKLDVMKLWKLFSLIEDGYRSSNPYHNSVHAADVTQAMHCFLQQDKILAYMEPLEIMSSLLAAIAHDLDHPGVNQAFLLSSSDFMVDLYHSTSVLENHHWRAAVSCIIESGVLESQEILAEVTRQISSLILATDISRQQEYLIRFKTYIDTNVLDMRERDHRHLVLQMALKCADISNPCRPWKISKLWSRYVCEEFFRQGECERRRNLPVTMLCDRDNTSIPAIQTSFFGFIVNPLITEWHRFLQNDLSTKMLKNLLHNESQWKKLLAKEKAEKTETEISDADQVDEDMETCSGINISGSTEHLLPLRRSSFNPTKTSSLKGQLRRFSVPLNVFQDSRFKAKDKSRDSSVSALHKEGVTMANSDANAPSEEAEKLLSTGKLLPDASITSITTPPQATRPKTVTKRGAWKLTRQQTFPTLETIAPSQSLASRPLYMSFEDAIYPSHCRTDFAMTTETEEMEGHPLWKHETYKTEKDDASESDNVDVANETFARKESVNVGNGRPALGMRRESLPVGTQLRDNLTAVPLSTSDQLLGRRKSMPTDADIYTPKEKTVREVTETLPQLLRRTLSGKESWSGRRGSAPAPVAPSEFRGLATLGALRHSLNGGRKKQGPLGTCQQWLAKSTYNGQERSFQQLPRRSSLPVEEYIPTESKKPSDTEL